MSAYTVTRPHPDHTPHVGREHVGYSMSGGARYATSLRCSCGARIGRVSNSAPSSPNGRRDAGRAYTAHLVGTYVVRRRNGVGVWVYLHRNLFTAAQQWTARITDAAVWSSIGPAMEAAERFGGEVTLR